MTRRRIGRDIQQYIEGGTLTGWTPPEIREALRGIPQFNGRVPTLRTVQRIAKEFVPSDESGPWTFNEADPDDAALVLPVLAEVIERTKGHRTEMTRAVAEKVARIRRVAPDLHLWVAYSLAVAYLAKEGTKTDDLDAFLAFAPWRGDENMKRHQHAVQEGWVSETWGLFAAYFSGTGHPLGAFLAAVEAGTLKVTVGGQDVEERESDDGPAKSKRRR